MASRLNAELAGISRASLKDCIKLDMVSQVCYQAFNAWASLSDLGTSTFVGAYVLKLLDGPLVAVCVLSLQTDRPVTDSCSQTLLKQGP